MGKLDPYANLTQVADHLAIYLSHISPDELKSVTEDVRKQYGAPRESWLWGPLYWLVNASNRLPDVDAAISEFAKTAEPKRLLDLIEDKKGGWEETSFNTNFLRTLVKKLPDYDESVKLDISNVKRLKELLVQSINVYLTKQIQTEGLQAKLDDLENTLSVKELEIQQKKQELEEYEKKLANLSVEESKKDKDIKTSSTRLIVLAQEIINKEKELEQVAKQHADEVAKISATYEFIRINTQALDLTGIDNKQIEEAKRNAEIAFKTYLIECRNKAQRQQEISSIHGGIFKRQEDLKLAISAVKTNEERTAELAIVKKQRADTDQTDIKLKLSQIFCKPAASKPKREEQLVSLFANGSHAEIAQKPEAVVIIENYEGNSTAKLPHPLSRKSTKAAPTREELLNELLTKKLKSNLEPAVEEKSSLRLV